VGGLKKELFDPVKKFSGRGLLLLSFWKKGE
jgi:hypothetical protein